MNAQLSAAPARIAVRMPFRVLAALMLVAGAAATACIPIISWTRGMPLPASFLLMLPLLASGLRFAYVAAIRATAPADLDR